jgi:hypothetical protein
VATTISGSISAYRHAARAEDTAIVLKRPLMRERPRRDCRRLGPAAATRIGALEGSGAQRRSSRRKDAHALAIQLRPEALTVAVEEASLSSEALTALLAARASSGKTREAGSHSITATPDIASSSKAESIKDSSVDGESGYQTASARPMKALAKKDEYCTAAMRAPGRIVLTAGER